MSTTESIFSGTTSEKALADALFLSIGEGAIVIDVQGRVSHVNHVATTILGFSADELLGKWFPGTVIAEDDTGNAIPFIERPIAEVFLTGKPAFRKLHYRRKDGSRVAVALTASPVFLNDKPIGAIEVFRDITEEVRLNEAKDEFISLASHQLRTPATAVRQYLAMLLEGYAGELTPEQEQYLRTATDSNDRQLRIIDDLLRVAAADSGKVVLQQETTNLVPLIAQVIAEQADSFASNGQTLVFQHSEESIYATIDINSFRMVLENLIDNAHKYTYPNKNVTVTLRSLKRSVRIAIKDEGTGIDPKEFPKLFKKFSRLDNPLSISSGGSGLGLYWVKKILELHEATITVDSTIGKGTTFTVVLPL